MNGELNMPKKIDLTNKKFGKLTVISQAEHIQTPNGRSHVAWNCQCECGNTCVIRGDTLRNNHTISCGCVQKENLRQSGLNRKLLLEGKKFGKLIVIKDSGKRDSCGGVLWECQCDCGNTILVSTSNLTRKKEATISCGCIKSKGEEKIISLLLEIQIPFITQKRFDSCIFPETNRQLVFDFYLPEQNLLIEYDGEQHFHKIRNDRYNFKEIQKRDAFKNEWCLQNNIKLIRIPYYDFDKLTIENMRRIIEHNRWKEVF